jgi:hypothetical protein
MDRHELAIKSVASLAFEGGILDEAHRGRHLRREKQIVAWSVAMDTVLLEQGADC